MTREDAYIAIAGIEGAAILFARASERELDLEDTRHLVKKAAMNRIIESGAATSATAAEKLVHEDIAYASHLQAQRAAVVEKIVFEGKFRAAQLRARLAVELCAIDEQARDDNSDPTNGEYTKALARRDLEGTTLLMKFVRYFGGTDDDRADLERDAARATGGNVSHREALIQDALALINQETL